MACMVFSAKPFDHSDFLMYNPQGVSGLAGGEASIRLRILKLVYATGPKKSSAIPEHGTAYHLRGGRPLTQVSTTIWPCLIAATSGRGSASKPSGGRESK